MDFFFSMCIFTSKVIAASEGARAVGIAAAQPGGGWLWILKSPGFLLDSNPLHSMLLCFVGANFMDIGRDIQKVLITFFCSLFVCTRFYPLSFVCALHNFLGHILSRFLILRFAVTSVPSLSLLHSNQKISHSIATKTVMELWRFGNLFTTCFLLNTSELLHPTLVSCVCEGILWSWHRRNAPYAGLVSSIFASRDYCSF